MNYFPLFADLTGRPVLVVGGGSVAARKVGLLLKANAQVRIVARQFKIKCYGLPKNLMSNK